MSSFKTAPSDFRQSKPMGFTKDERAYRERRMVWWNKVQWRTDKGIGDPRHARAFYEVYDRMLETRDETELTAWIQAYNRGER